MTSHRRQSPRGYLLLEAMIASVILAVASVGIVSLLLSAHEQEQSIQESNTATLLAKQLIEEISAKPLGAYPAVTPLPPRSQFTTAAQYDNYQDSTATMTTLGGETVPVANVGTYTRSVAISSPAVSETNPNDVLMVTVTVKTPSGKTVNLSKWLTNVTWGF